VKRVLVDNGLGLNICTLTLIKHLGFPKMTLDPNIITIKAYENAERESVGTIHLPIMVGPVMRQTLFHVIDLDLTYNILLGRPWIHAIQYVPSTFHQCIKFPYASIEVTVLGDPQPFQYCKMLEGQYRKTNFYPITKDTSKMDIPTTPEMTKPSLYIHPDDVPST